MYLCSTLLIFFIKHRKIIRHEVWISWSHTKTTFICLKFVDNNHVYIKMVLCNQNVKNIKVLKCKNIPLFSYEVLSFLLPKVIHTQANKVNKAVLTRLVLEWQPCRVHRESVVPTTVDAHQTYFHPTWNAVWYILRDHQLTIEKLRRLKACYQIDQKQQANQKIKHKWKYLLKKKQEEEDEI